MNSHTAIPVKRLSFLVFYEISKKQTENSATQSVTILLLPEAQVSTNSFVVYFEDKQGCQLLFTDCFEIANLFYYFFALKNNRYFCFVIFVPMTGVSSPIKTEINSSVEILLIKIFFEEIYFYRKVFLQSEAVL